MTALFLQGNARDVLKGLPPDYFHCAVTSPPYFGLRRYDGGEEIWDGDDDCEHEWSSGMRPKNTWGEPNSGGTATGKMAIKGKSNYAVVPESKFGLCIKCGAWKGQLGAEPTPELYISHLVQVCREVRRVLRPDGVFWLNIGDSWAGSGKGQMGDGSAWAATHNCKQSTVTGSIVGGLPKQKMTNGCKPLDMVLIPSLLAIALRADGWYVRSQVVWSKNNPMPESVNGWRWERHRVKTERTAHEDALQSRVERNGVPRTTEGLNVRRDRGAVDGWQDCPGCSKCSPHDGYVLRKGSWRPTDSYEIILMLTKTGNYYCDRESVLEPHQTKNLEYEMRKSSKWGHKKRLTCKPNVDDYLVDTHSYSQGGRNLRSVWEFPTKPYSGAHFAVFPPRLPELCVKSSTSEKGCCPECGAPWARVMERGLTEHDGSTDCSYPVGTTANRLALLRQASRERGVEYANSSNTIGWMPTCSCSLSDPIPCRVLDPFSGAGTTALVCEQLGMDSIGIDTSEEYIQLAEARIADDEQKRIDEQIKQLRREAKLSNKNG